MQKLINLSIALLIVSLVAACGGKKEQDGQAVLKKEVSAEDRKLAAQAAGDALYANFLNDHAAAEKALARAASLNPANADYWFDLGIARIRTKDKAGATAAFKNVISVCASEAAKDPNNAAWLVKQIRPMVILGRVDEARALRDNILKQFPADRQVGVFTDPKAIDRLLEDPLLKQYTNP